MRCTTTVPLAITASICSAFTPPQTTSSSINVNKRTRATATKMMPSPDDVHTAHHHLSTLLSDHSFTSTWIADAAVDAVVDKEDIGLWESYIQLYKNGLAFVHDNIVDEPLRKMGFTQTWGPSIFLFTAGVRSLLVPFSIQQSKSSEYMKALKPYTQKIKERYKDENMRNRATAKLFEDAKQNPLAGCVTSFAQIPIFLGLYRSVTRLAQEGRLDEPFLWIPSLEGPVTAENNYRGMEWLTEGWNNGVPTLGWETTLAFCVMPVLLVLGQSLTMQVLQPPEDESGSDEEQEQMKTTKTILKFLPLMIGYFSLQVPAGLTIYWFTSNLFTVSQSLLIRGYYAANPPKIELPEYWGALDKGGEEMSADEKRAAAMAGLSTGPSFDELLEEAKFHYVVKRNPIREDSEAWTRVKSSSSTEFIPQEMKSWVEADVKAEVQASSQVA